MSANSVLKERDVYKMHIFADISAVCLVLVGTGFAGISEARAQTTSDKMSCSAAVATYERNGRIYVRTRSGTVLPIDRPVPVSQKSRLSGCHGRNVSRSPYNVRTTDVRNCTIGYVCQ
jgi:hypothetical protein